MNIPENLVDSRHSIFNDISGNQYNVSTVYNGVDALQSLEPVRMDASRRKGCLENTRTEVLRFIVDWVNDSSSHENILWLHGLAGSGKSALSNTIADTFRSSNQLGAFLFFDRDVTERSDPAAVVRTMAHQLSASDQVYATWLGDTIKNNPNITLSPISHQFQKLILEVSLAIDSPSKPNVIVMDALDECGKPDERDSLLAALCEKFARMPSGVRAIITSRAVVDICDAFEDQAHILSYELDITSQINSDDILSYFRHRITDIRAKKSRMKHLGPEWPDERSFRRLVDKASGLFVWASTASEFIDGYDPKKRLDILLQKEMTPGADAALDTLYAIALESVGLWDDEDFISDFHAILGVVLLVRQPLSSMAIDALLNLPETKPSSYTTSLLRCVLQQTPTVRVLHPSFSDFLTSRSRSGRDSWFFELQAHNQRLAFLCFDRMDTTLRYNICNITLCIVPGSLAEDISYACMFWIDHVCLSEHKNDITALMDRTRRFLYRHLLHWFEAMSILKRSRDTVKLLQRLLTWVIVHRDSEKSFIAFIRDALRFAQVFGSSMHEHPLLVYQTALSFSPTDSTVYRAFCDQYSPVCPSIAGGLERVWSPLVLVMSNHEDSVLSLSFSADSGHIVSGSKDRTVRVWDATSGAQILPALVGHEGPVSSVLFSPDGTRIVSGSHDKTIRVWDATSGNGILPPFKGHTLSIRAVAISSDGIRIASGSDDTSVRIWDMINGSEITHAIKWHSKAVLSVDFSPDGHHILSGSEDGTVKIWKVAGDSAILSFRGHLSAVRSVGLSTEGNLIVSGSSDGTIRVWDSTSGVETCPPLLEHTEEIWSAVTCVAGTHAVSGSEDGTLRVWNSDIGEELLRIRCDASPIISTTYSPDGTLVASGSEGKSIRVWDVASGVHQPPKFPRHDDSVMSVAFSADGAQVASGSLDRTIRVWNTASGAEAPMILRGHTRAVLSVAFSPTGDLIASGSADQSLRVWTWDGTSGRHISGPQWHDGWVVSVVFSLDGNRIISSTNGDSFQVHDAVSGMLVCRLHANYSGGGLGTFSSCGSYAMSMLGNEVTHIWNATSGETISEKKVLKHLHHADFLSDQISISDDGWVRDLTNNNKLSKLPPFIENYCRAIRRRSLAIGTLDGRCIILHFPPSKFE